MGFFKRKRDPDTILAEATEHMDAGNLDQALKLLDEALQLAPEHGQAWYFKGCILSQKEDYRGAIHCYANSAKNAGDLAYLPLYNMGNAFQELEQFDEALECFTMATDVNPEMADAWINRGRLLDDSGKHAQAIECYDIALKTEPNDVMAWSNRGNSLRALGRWKEAEESYQRAIRLDSSDRAALIGLGVCLGRTGEPERGLQFLDRALAAGPDPHALGERATLLSTLERHDEALKCIDQTIASGAKSPQVWNNRGEILAKLKRLEDSLASFDKSLEIDGSFAPAWFGKARVLCNHGRTAEARACIEKYFVAAPADDELQEAARGLVALCDGSRAG
jgi:tetratricopeptide (TPR) repeat protein